MSTCSGLHSIQKHHNVQWGSGCWSHWHSQLILTLWDIFSWLINTNPYLESPTLPFLFHSNMFWLSSKNNKKVAFTKLEDKEEENNFTGEQRTGRDLSEQESQRPSPERNMKNTHEQLQAAVTRSSNYIQQDEWSSRKQESVSSGNLKAIACNSGRRKTSFKVIINSPGHKEAETGVWDSVKSAGAHWKTLQDFIAHWATPNMMGGL